MRLLQLTGIQGTRLDVNMDLVGKVVSTADRRASWSRKKWKAVRDHLPPPYTELLLIREEPGFPRPRHLVLESKGEILRMYSQAFGRNFVPSF